MTKSNCPRALHKLNLQPGDVVNHVGWQGGPMFSHCASFYCDNARKNVVSKTYGTWPIDKGQYPKGARPLFTVISRAKPELARGEMIMAGWFFRGLMSLDQRDVADDDTHRLTIPTIGGNLIPGKYTGPDGAVITIAMSGGKA